MGGTGHGQRQQEVQVVPRVALQVAGQPGEEKTPEPRFPPALDGEKPNQRKPTNNEQPGDEDRPGFGGGSLCTL